MLFVIYRILWWVILPWVLFFRYWKDKKSGQGWRYGIERLGFASTTKNHDIILHAVSLGEVRAMTPLVLEILKVFPQQSILITTTTLTGRAQLEKTFGSRVSIAFLPHDVGFFIRRFLKKINPKVLMIMETEIWPNLLVSCEKLNIPTLIISACLSERSQRGYSKIPKTIEKLLLNVSILAQTVEDQERFKAIGAGNVSVMGNLKYITVLPEDFDSTVQKILQGKSDDDLLWCLASSHDGEEKLILDAFMALKDQLPHLKLAIAPRHPERFNSVEVLIQDYGLTYQKRSNTGFDQFTLSNHDLWLFDSIGELLYLYGASDIVTVAGSFVPIGGHNILEPAFLSKVITCGPYIDNIVDMTEFFKKNNAIKVLSVDQLQKEISVLVNDQNLRNEMGKNAHQCVMQNQKALSCVFKELEQHIKE